MKVLFDLLFGLGVVCVCAPAVVVVGICGVGTLVSHTIRVIRNLVLSIFVGEVSWCDWAVRMGDLCVGSWRGRWNLNSQEKGQQFCVFNS
jgi:hypothetical protein